MKSRTIGLSITTRAALAVFLFVPSVRAATPLIELNFNTSAGVQSLLSVGSLSATGTFTGNAAYSTDVPDVNPDGYSGVFDGTGDRVSLGNLSGLNGLTSFTICGWVKFTATQANSSPRLVSYRVNDGSSAGFDLIMSNATGTPKLQVLINGTLATDTTTVSYGTWVFVAVSYDGTKTSNNVQFYVGNADSLTTTSLQTSNTGTVGIVASQVLQIGGVTTVPTDDTRDFEGNMDGFQIYGSTTDDTGVLTETQIDNIRSTPDCRAINPLIQLDFNTSSGAPSLVSKGTIVTTGTFTGNAAYSTTVPSINPGGDSGTFDGTGDRVNFGNQAALNSLTSFTICGWVYFTSTQANGAPRLVSYRTNSGNTSGFDLIMSTATTTPRLQTLINGTLATDTTNVPYSGWEFVAATYDGTQASNNVKFYIGNSSSLAATSTQTSNTGTVAILAGQILQIGGVTTVPDGTRDFEGKMDGFQIYGATSGNSGVLTEAQLDAIRTTPDCETGTWRSSYAMYNPTVSIHTVYSGQSHDSALVYFGGTWLAQWDGGTETSPQYIYQSTSTNLSTWSPPIMPYMASGGATNPITDVFQWQPSLLVVNSQLWSFFMGTNDMWFSKLSSPTGTWTNAALVGPAKTAQYFNPQYAYPTYEGEPWSLYPGNAGTILADGSVVVPVTWTDTYNPGGLAWISIPKQDGMIRSTDGGSTWTFDPGVTFGSNAAECWENTIWEPTSGTLNMASRANRESPPNLSPLQNIKSATSTNYGSSWTSEAYIPQDFAMSRVHVVRKGARNIMAQNDWYLTTDLISNRRNISLFFSRGNRNDDFVAGLNFCAGDGDEVDTTRVDYPQIATNGSTCAVIYTNFGAGEGNGTPATTATKVASFTLPSDSSYYIFPRQGYDDVNAVTVDGRTAARFNDSYCSAGIDIDANTSGNTLCVSFAIKPETNGRQCIFNLSNGVKLFTNNGRITMKEWQNGGSVEVDCGALPLNSWSVVDFVSGGGVSQARANGGSYTSVANAPYPWKAYFGDNIYESDPTPVDGQSFCIDLLSINSLVK